MAVSATMPMQAVVSAGVVPQAAVATLVVHVNAMAVVLTTAAHADISAKSNPASSHAAKRVSTHAKTVAVLKPLAVAIGLRTVLHLHTHGTVATTAAHLAKTHDKMAPGLAVVGKNAAATTATAPAQRPAVPQLTSSRVAPSSLVPATSSLMALLVKALPANVAVHVC